MPPHLSWLAALNRLLHKIFPKERAPDDAPKFCVIIEVRRLRFFLRFSQHYVAAYIIPTCAKWGGGSALFRVVRIISFSHSPSPVHPMCLWTTTTRQRRKQYTKNFNAKYESKFDGKKKKRAFSGLNSFLRLYHVLVCRNFGFLARLIVWREKMKDEKSRKSNAGRDVGGKVQKNSKRVGVCTVTSCIDTRVGINTNIKYL